MAALDSSVTFLLSGTEIVMAEYLKQLSLTEGVVDRYVAESERFWV